MGKGEKRLKVVDINPKVTQAIKELETMIEGCWAVRELGDLPQQAQDLVTLVIRDCNRVIATLQGKRLPGDDQG
jgi:peptide deformylase